MRSRYTGQNKGRDSAAASRLKAFCRFGKRCACGHDIIDKKDWPALQRCDGCRWHGEGARNIAFALLPVQPALAARRAPADQQLRGELATPGGRAQVTCQLGRLVERRL